jgi:HD-like signal output (HDOD) protein
MVERDPALCARVLAVASSPVYGGRGVGSVKQAVARLGTATVADLATAVALKGALCVAGPYDALLARCWRSCVGMGVFAREVARTRRRGVDSAFLCGLFRGVGRPIALNMLTRLGYECSEQVADAIAARHQVRLGVRAVMDWGLEPFIADTIAHGDVANPPAETADAVFTVQLADALMRWHEELDAPEAEALVTRMDTSAAVVALSLYPEDLEGIRDRAGAVTAALEALQ